jgi:hypothetical protein
MTMILILITILFVSVIFVCKKTNVLKDKYLDELYKKREAIKLNYALDPTPENENEIKKINREIDIRLHTDG